MSKPTAQTRSRMHAGSMPTSPTADKALGVYVHIPFCLVRCGYCDFNAYSGMDDLIEPFTEALICEIKRTEVSTVNPITSIFFGGGTPSYLQPHQLAGILAALEETFGVAPGCEISLEANPETVSLNKLAEIRSSGFNRISIGVQSLSEEVLKALDRAHSAPAALQAILEARAAGFESINADLIYGTPGESIEDWQRSLDGVIEVHPDHISIYPLTVEQGTPLANLVERKRVAAPDDDDQADKYGLGVERLESAGFARYEISNFSREDAWCLQNLVYWRGGGYYAFGPGAHGHIEGRRWWNIRSPQQYIRRIARSDTVVEGEERLDARNRAAEQMVLGLRLAGGIDRQQFRLVHGFDPISRWDDDIRACASSGLLNVSAERLMLTERGFFLSNRVLCRFV